MTMTYVLVVYLFFGGTGGPTSIQMRDRAACEAAAKNIKDKFKDMYKGYVCLSLFDGS